MQAQDATTVYLLKLWPRIEANKNRILAGAVVVVIAIAVAWVLASQHDQKEAEAGEALTKLSLSPTVTPEGLLKIASDYPGTAAAERAMVLGAGALFTTGKYAEAQAQFQKYLDEHPDGEFFGQAALGLGVCLETQGKADQATGVYQRAIDNSSDTVVVTVAKLSLGKICEAQGKISDAQKYYEQIAKERINQETSLGREAMLRLTLLKKAAPATPGSAPAPVVTVPPAATK